MGYIFLLNLRALTYAPPASLTTAPEHLADLPHLVLTILFEAPILTKFHSYVHFSSRKSINSSNTHSQWLVHNYKFQLTIQTAQGCTHCGPDFGSRFLNFIDHSTVCRQFVNYSVGVRSIKPGCVVKFEASGVSETLVTASLPEILPRHVPCTRLVSSTSIPPVAHHPVGRQEFSSTKAFSRIPAVKSGVLNGSRKFGKWGRAFPKR